MRVSNQTSSESRAGTYTRDTFIAKIQPPIKVGKSIGGLSHVGHVEYKGALRVERVKGQRYPYCMRIFYMLMG